MSGLNLIGDYFEILGQVKSSANSEHFPRDGAPLHENSLAWTGHSLLTTKTAVGKHAG